MRWDHFHLHWWDKKLLNLGFTHMGDDTVDDTTVYKANNFTFWVEIDTARGFDFYFNNVVPFLKFRLKGD